MVSICAGCNLYEPWAAAIVAIIAGILYVFFSRMMLAFKVTFIQILNNFPRSTTRWTRLQSTQAPDPGVSLPRPSSSRWFELFRQSGFLSTPSLPFFVQGGIFFGGGEAALKMLMWNALAGAAVVGWYSITAVFIFGALMVLRVFRVNEAQEIQGLDVVKHNEPAYPIGE